MASKTGAYALVVGGVVIAYSAVTKRSVIDTLLMRPSPGNISQTESTAAAAAQATSGTMTGGVYLAGDQAVGGLRQAVLQAASQAIDSPNGTYEYDEVRPYPPNLFGPPIPVKTDCSGFVTLCYKYAGAPDPNGLGYSGMGYTATLLARGTPVKQGRPGDLAFWSNPSHVAIYAGNLQVYEFGGDPGPIATGLVTEDGYHQAFLGFRSYLP